MLLGTQSVKSIGRHKRFIFTAIGAGVGTIFGPIGTGIGAAIGAVIDIIACVLSWCKIIFFFSFKTYFAYCLSEP